MSTSRPYTNAVYLLLVPPAKIRAYRRVLFRYYDANGGSLPDVVVRMSEILGLEGNQRVEYNRIDPLDRLVRRNNTYRLAARRPQYAIYYRRSDRCLSPK